MLLGVHSFTDAVRNFNEEELISLELVTSSKGNQKKWYCKEEKLFIKGQFQYQGENWKDYLVERCSYLLSKQLIACATPVLEQRIGRVQGIEGTVDGVYSKDFRTNESEHFLSFQRILDREGISWQDSSFPGAKFVFVLRVMEEVFPSTLGRAYFDYANEKLQEVCKLNGNKSR
ncbi:MAG: hypothetical protein RRY80_10120 [Lachnospiraceae bacterium]